MTHCEMCTYSWVCALGVCSAGVTWLLQCSSNDFGVLGILALVVQETACVGPTSLQCGEKISASIVQ